VAVFFLYATGTSCNDLLRRWRRWTSTGARLSVRVYARAGLRSASLSPPSPQPLPSPRAICQLESGLIRGKRATRELLENFLRTREQSQSSAARAVQWNVKRAP